MSRISVKINQKSKERICQCDLFEAIEVFESIEVIGSEIKISKLSFPFIICLNQDCDLENDYNSTEKSDSRLLHIAIAPVFNFEQFLSGKHWGDICDPTTKGKRADTRINSIMQNETSRYHYLKFDDESKPELIIDFKHFFTVPRDFLYQNIDKRFCRIDDLFREKISQRFSYFISRIGLPT